MGDARIHIGTSGFSYKDWQGNFYPDFLSARDYLRYYASQFRSVEIDSTFYRIPSAEMVAKWKDATPADFVFAAKFPRMVTHEGDLSERMDSAARFVEVMRLLDTKLGPLLLQFPYSFKPDQRDLLARLIEAMPDDIPVSVELRNKAWLGDELFDLLRRHNRPLCLIDHPWMPRLSVQTGPFQYIRLLGDRKKIENDFSYIRDDREADLGHWQDVISGAAQGGADVFVYVNNHYSGHSPSTARRLLALLNS